MYSVVQHAEAKSTALYNELEMCVRNFGSHCCGLIPRLNLQLQEGTFHDTPTSHAAHARRCLTLRKFIQLLLS